MNFTINHFFISQIFACGSLVVTVLSFWGKEKKSMIAMLVLDSLFLACSYMFLGEFSGAATNVICLGRNLFAIYKEKNPYFDKPVFFILFAMVHTVACGLTFTGPVSLLPLLAAYICCFYSYSKNDTVVRFGIAAMVAVWLIYDIAVGSYASIVAESIALCSAVAAIFKLEVIPRMKKKEKRAREKEAALYTDLDDVCMNSVSISIAM